MNMFVSSFDYYKWTNSRITRKQKIIFSVVVLISIVVTLVGVNYV
jgi:electron transport complex protein RnfD